MASLRELREKMHERMGELQPRIEAGARLLLERGDLLAALDELSPICRPDGFLDPMRVHATAGHCSTHPLRVAIHNAFNEKRHQTDGDEVVEFTLYERLLLESPHTHVADAMLYLGEVEAAATIYGQRGGLDGENSVAVCHDLLDRHREAEAHWRSLLGTWSERALELVPVRYNLALALFMEGRLVEAMTEFKACRSVYLRYRDVGFFIDWIKAALPHGGPSFDPIAVAMPIPRYSVVEATARFRKS